MRVDRALQERGIGKARQVLGDTPVEDDVHQAVQALHDKYVSAGVQYDDTSTRMTVMKDWGYRMIFSGNVPWRQLPKVANFSVNKRYIIDIEGHTVKMRVKKAPPRSQEVDAVDEYFECESDPTNYNTSAFLKNVLYVWQST